MIIGLWLSKTLKYVQINWNVLPQTPDTAKRWIHFCSYRHKKYPVANFTFKRPCRHSLSLSHIMSACKSVHCCMCLEHNKGRHSPLGAMNRTRSLSCYPWCPARVCLDRAAMLSVWKLGAAANRGWNPSPSASSTCEYPSVLKPYFPPEPF